MRKKDNDYYPFFKRYSEGKNICLTTIIIFPYNYVLY